MITDDMTIQFTAMQLQHVVREHKALPLDDRQAEALARYVNDLQGKLDDFSDKCDELEERIKYLQDHPPGCRCVNCAVP